MEESNKVFLIDDDRLSNFVNRSILRSIGLGFKVFPFENAEDGLQKLKELIAAKLPLPELILLDINLPIMDGWEFLVEYDKLIPEMQTRAMIYMLTASVDKRDMEKADSSPHVTGIITKPFRVEKLSEILHLVAR